jgi:hypothetical protein
VPIVLAILAQAQTWTRVGFLLLAGFFGCAASQAVVKSLFFLSSLIFSSI